MKYFVTVDGSTHEVELEERLGELHVRFAGEDVDVGFDEVDRLGQIALFLADKSYGVSIEGDARNAFVTVAGHVYRVEVEDERERAAHAAQRKGGGRGGDVKSVMPGVVVDLLVQEGDEVEEGQSLLILEAMKMQNEITAAQAGRVKRVHVTQGQAVGSGAKLIQIEARPEA